MMPQTCVNANSSSEGSLFYCARNLTNNSGEVDDVHGFNSFGEEVANIGFLDEITQHFNTTNVFPNAINDLYTSNGEHIVDRSSNPKDINTFSGGNGNVLEGFDVSEWLVDQPPQQHVENIPQSTLVPQICNPIAEVQKHVHQLNDVAENNLIYTINATAGDSNSGAIAREIFAPESTTIDKGSEGIFKASQQIHCVEVGENLGINDLNNIPQNVLNTNRILGETGRTEAQTRNAIEKVPTAEREELEAVPELSEGIVGELLAPSYGYEDPTMNYDTNAIVYTNNNNHFQSVAENPMLVPSVLNNAMLEAAQSAAQSQQRLLDASKATVVQPISQQALGTTQLDPRLVLSEMVSEPIANSGLAQNTSFPAQSLITAQDGVWQNQVANRAIFNSADDIAVAAQLPSAVFAVPFDNTNAAQVQGSRAIIPTASYVIAPGSNNVVNDGIPSQLVMRVSNNLHEQPTHVPQAVPVNYNEQVRQPTTALPSNVEQSNGYFQPSTNQQTKQDGMPNRPGNSPQVKNAEEKEVINFVAVEMKSPSISAPNSPGYGRIENRPETFDSRKEEHRWWAARYRLRKTEKTKLEKDAQVLDIEIRKRALLWQSTGQARMDLRDMNEAIEDERQMLATEEANAARAEVEGRELEQRIRNRTSVEASRKRKEVALQQMAELRDTQNREHDILEKMIEEIGNTPLGQEIIEEEIQQAEETQQVSLGVRRIATAVLALEQGTQSSRQIGVGSNKLTEADIRNENVGNSGRQSLGKAKRGRQKGGNSNHLGECDGDNTQPTKKRKTNGESKKKGGGRKRKNDGDAGPNRKRTK